MSRVPAVGVRSNMTRFESSGSYMGAAAKATESTAPALTIGRLEADYPTYCKALRMLIRDGHTLNKIKKTVCWDRLQLLHDAMPRVYRDPIVHYGMLKRDIESQQAV